VAATRRRPENQGQRLEDCELGAPLSGGLAISPGGGEPTAKAGSSAGRFRSRIIQDELKKSSVQVTVKFKK
jgi:hypothetical protein